MIAYTTRNRPTVLEYSLSKTREVYDGQIIVVDDNSDTKDQNFQICMKYDAIHLYNDTRLGIPRSKHRGFNALSLCDYQYWLDDDCFLKQGLERIQAAQQYHPHLLHLKEWCHIRRTADVGFGIASFSGASACFMAFTKELYPEMLGFHDGFGHYGGWHHKLSLKLGGYFALEDSSDYIHSFDIDGTPKDFGANFGSSLPTNERIKK